MGRVRIAKALIRSIIEKKESSKKRKHELINYLHKLKESYATGKISYSRYVEILHKKTDGRNLSEWIEYYDYYEKECEKERKKHQAKLTRRKFLTTFLSIFLVSFLIYFALFSNYENLNFTGFAIRGEARAQEFSQDLNLTFSSSADYEWKLENTGQLTSLKLSGLIEEQSGGNVKIYLDDLLILDSSDITTAESNATKSSESSSPGIFASFLGILGNIGITGNVIDGGEGATSESTESSDSDSSAETTETSSPNEESAEVSENPASSDSSSATNQEENSVSETSGSVEESTTTEIQNEITSSTTETQNELTINPANENLNNFPVEESSENPIIETTDEISGSSTTEITEQISETPDNQLSNQSNSEELNETSALPNETSNPFQEEPQASGTTTYNSENETNITKLNETEIQSEINITETPSEANITKNITEINETKIPIEAEINITELVIKTFTEFCKDSCNLKNLNLNKSSYTLRIEISNAKLQLNKLTYEIIPEKVEELNISLIENITVNTTQYSAVLGQPVKWKKQISLEEAGSVRIELPKEAENIIINKILQEEFQNSEDEYQEEQKEKANANIEIKTKEEYYSEKSEIPSFGITGNAVSEGTSISETGEEIIEVLIEDNATKYEIEYETPAPYAIEEENPRGKRVNIISPETIHYENVLIFTTLNETLSIKNPSRIKIHWIENNSYLSPISIQDKDNNGIYDYIEFIAPQLSNQTFEIIIITKAEHLSSNREFISDIYEQVKSLDNIWSETIPENDYVRVTFEVPLDNTRDITLYPRITSGNPRIEVYEIDGTEKIAEFSSLNSNEYNKVFLTNLVGEQDTFDLRVTGGSIELEHIIDPKSFYNMNPAHRAYWGQPTTSNRWLAGTNATIAQYNNMNSENGAYADNIMATGTSQDEPFWRFNFTVAEDVSTINSLYIKFTGYSNTSATGAEVATLYIYNVDGTWETIGALSTSANTNVTLNITSAIGSYINSTNKQVLLVVEGANFDAGESLRVDHVQVTIQYTELDNTPPYFTIIPANSSLFYGNESLNVDFDATDAVGFGYFAINDTRFSITQAGILTNATPISVGNYEINVTINDSSNNINWTRYKVQINKSLNYDCGVYFNATSPITYPATFIVYTNCSSDYTLYRNQTSISNNSVVNSGAGYYNLTVQRTDTANYTYTVNSQFFTVSNGTLTGTLASTKGWTYVYDGTSTTISSSESNNGDTDVVYKIWRDNSDKNSGETVNLAVGGYSYKLNSTGGANYSSIASIDAQTLTINQNTTDKCQIFYNATSPLTYPTSFRVWHNCTTAATLKRNDTTIENNSEIINGATAYNFSMFRTDTVNYSNVYNESQFIINKNTDICGVYFNATSGINYPDLFIVYTNCSSNYNLYRNGSSISNNSVVNSGAGYYNLTVQRTDTANYTNTVNSQFFTISNGTLAGTLSSTKGWTYVYDGTSTTISSSESNNGDSDVVYKIWRDNSDKSSGETVNLAVGGYSYKLNSTGGANYSSIASINAQTLTINQNTTDRCQIFYNATSGIIHPDTYLAWHNCTTAATLKRNDTTISNNSVQNSGWGAYNFSMFRTDTVNYSNVYNESQFIVNKNTDVCGVYFNATSPITYPATFIVYTNCSSNYNLYRNGSSISNNSVVNSGAGYYNLTVQRTDTANYTYTTDSQFFTVNKDTTNKFQIFYNETSPLTYPKAFKVWTNCTTAATLKRNDTITENNSEQSLAISAYNFSALRTDIQNYSYVYNESQFRIIEISNTPPEIVAVYNSTEMTDVSPGPNEGPVATYVILNFTAYDAQGFGNLNDSSVQVNFSKAGEESRLNTSCALLNDYNTNYANYTCNVTMWWWDASGTWTINSSISDLDGNSAFNDSTNFYIGSTTGLLANSSSVGWPEISPGASNQEANSPTLLNNTGNVQVSVEVNATNLTGDNNPSYSLGASNFSVHTLAGCGGTTMSWYSYKTVIGAVIPKGNYTKDDGTAQETIYFCLEESNANLIAQPYSTTAQGTWTIRIFLAAFVIRRKKKEKKAEEDNLLNAINIIADKLKEEYSLTEREMVETIVEKLKKKYNLTRNEFLEIIKAREGITIPITIFTKELGGLEAVTKYMKENMKMNYREIAKELRRDERTIWTAYKKTTEKQEEQIKPKETEINLPISIFENKELTILEAIIIYLKEKEMKYSEIAELLNRDQRNIWTIYSRAIKKINKKGLNK